MMACNPVQTTLGYVAGIVASEPGIIEKVTKLGFEARLQGRTLADNPYIIDGPYGWWKTGWLKADQLQT